MVVLVLGVFVVGGALAVIAGAAAVCCAAVDSSEAWRGEN
jgi:hypothetical protein